MLSNACNVCDFEDEACWTCYKFFIKLCKLNANNVEVNWINSWHVHIQQYTGRAIPVMGESFSKYSSSPAKNLGTHFTVFLTVPDAIRAWNKQ